MSELEQKKVFKVWLEKPGQENIPEQDREYQITEIEQKPYIDALKQDCLESWLNMSPRLDNIECAIELINDNQIFSDPIKILEHCLKHGEYWCNSDKYKSEIKFLKFIVKTKNINLLKIFLENSHGAQFIEFKYSYDLKRYYNLLEYFLYEDKSENEFPDLEAIKLCVENGFDIKQEYVDYARNNNFKELWLYLKQGHDAHFVKSAVTIENSKKV